MVTKKGLRIGGLVGILALLGLGLSLISRIEPISDQKVVQYPYGPITSVGLPSDIEQLETDLPAECSGRYSDGRTLSVLAERSGGALDDFIQTLGPRSDEYVKTQRVGINWQLAHNADGFVARTESGGWTIAVMGGGRWRAETISRILESVTLKASP